MDVVLFRFAARTLPVWLVLALAACAGPDYEQIFQQSLAREALSCLHPRGVLESAGDFQKIDADTFSGTLRWKGTVLEAEHVTRVRVRIEDRIARVYLAEDTALLPAARQTCEIPLAAE